jgi:hypothetical protein
VTCKQEKTQAKFWFFLVFLDVLPHLFFSDMFHCKSFFGLRLHLLRFGWPVYDQRAAGDWASYTSVQMDGDMLGSVG